MQTCIDDYIQSLSKANRTGIGIRGKRNVRAVLEYLFSHTAVVLAQSVALPPAAEMELRFIEGISLFIIPGLARTPPVALTATAETVGFFRDGNISPAVKEVAEADIEAAGCAYLDLPRGTFPVGEDRRIRMILARPQNGRLRFTSAVAPHSGNKARRFSWFAGETSVCGGSDVRTWIAESGGHIDVGLNLDEPEQPIEPLLGRSPREICRLLRQIEKVMFLAMAQRRSLIDAGDEAALIDLPHVALTDLRGRSGHRKQIGRKTSIFRIKRLPHLQGITVERASYSGPRTVFRRDETGPRRLVQVRGFYRMQPYGPKRGLRRLVWIPTHKRWVRDDGRTEMIALSGPLAA